MEKVKVDKLKKYLGKDIEIYGFVQKIRGQSKHKFLMLRDFSGLVQCISYIKDGEIFEKISEISVESVVKIKGFVKEEKQALNNLEIHIKEIEILSKSDKLPIQVVEREGEASFSKRHDFRWLDLRKEKNRDLIKLWNELERGFRRYFEKENYLQIYTPCFMETSSESGAEVFEVKYFDKKAYLSQSPQFYKQMAMSSGFEKIFTFGPIFRAEKSNTTRHLTEFTGLDFEISYVFEIEDLIEIEKDILIYTYKYLKDKKFIEKELTKKDFFIISLNDAKKLLKEKSIASDEKDDLSTIEEKELCNLIKKKFGADFVFVKNYPISKRPFYHMRYENNSSLTKSFDLLYKGIEITTSAIREHRIEILKKQAIEKKMDLKKLENYLNFFKFGCPPHGGGGIGIGRIIQKILDLDSIKDATFLVRDVNRLGP